MRKLFALTLLSILLPMNFVFAQISPDDIGLKETANTAGYDTNEATTAFGTYIGARIINPLFSLVGVIFLILIIYGGLLWMTGGGKEETLKKAKSILTNSLLGLVIVLLAYGLTRYIFLALAG
ncbi:MAG: hypothetical protein ABH846_01330 [Patescibacteria group bacterium]